MGTTGTVQTQLLTVALVLILGVGLANEAEAGSSPGPLAPPTKVLDDAVTFLWDHVDEDGCVSGSARNTAWAVMAITAAGQDPHQTGQTGKSLVEGLKACEPGRMLFGEHLTSLQRHLLAIVAAGEGPTDFNGRDWEQEIRSAATSNGFFDPNRPNGLNDDMFGILALAAAGAPPSDPDIQNAADRLLDNQNNDGGWSHSTSITDDGSDTDMTAAALQALVHAERITPGDEVTESALDFLEKRATDTDNGEHPGCLSPRSDLPQSDTDSTSWGILGLLAVHEDPRDLPWGTHGGPWNCLLELQQDDGGFPAAPGANSAPWPTAYVIIALTGSPFATIAPDMDRPSARFHVDETPIRNQSMTLHAQDVPYASWQHEEGTIHAGTTIQWTPATSGIHNFSILLLDDHGLAGIARHPVLVLEAPISQENGTHPITKEAQAPQVGRFVLHAPTTTHTGTATTIRFTLENVHTPAAYRLDWGDGNVTNWLNAPQAEHTYEEPGQHTVTGWARTTNGTLYGPEQRTLHVDNDPAAAQNDPLIPKEIPDAASMMAFSLILAALFAVRHRTARQAL